LGLHPIAKVIIKEGKRNVQSKVVQCSLHIVKGIGNRCTDIIVEGLKRVTFDVFFFWKQREEHYLR